MNRYLIIASVLAVAGCSASTPPERLGSTAASAQAASRGDTISIRLGESAFIDDRRLELRFDARVSDGRCPANANCVWVGDAHVRVTSRVAGGVPKSADLHTGLEPRAITVDRYVVTMVGMTPYPGLGNENEAPVLLVRVSDK